MRPVHLRQVDKAGPLKRMFAANLSKGGMFVRSPTPLPPGTRVEVFLEAKGRVLRFAEATVAFALPREEAVSRGRLPGNGLVFTSLPARSRALVHQLLKMVPELPAPAATPAARRARSHSAVPVVSEARRGPYVRAAAVALAGGAMAAASWFSHLPAWLH